MAPRRPQKVIAQAKEGRGVKGPVPLREMNKQPCPGDLEVRIASPVKTALVRN